MHPAVPRGPGELWFRLPVGLTDPADVSYDSKGPAPKRGPALFHLSAVYRRLAALEPAPNQ